MRKIVIAVALATSAAVAIPVIAQMPPTQPGAKDASRVKAGTYTVDSAHTQILWEVNHLGFNDYFGIFGNPTGTLKIDPANLSAASVDIQIPINQVVTNSNGLTQHLLGSDFFEATKFPTATFKSTSVVVDGDDAKITGNLTIKGVTKQVVLDAEFQGAGLFAMTKKDTIGFEAETKIKRSDFGVSYGIPMVPDEVELKISVAFEKPAA
ncbi:Polyisoprenoid-binding protein YceI [Sphingomonas laterariae]|uniref:Polyisoprenoid-binding protein YceI n=1 Tax=Edaphosphingomonas laterariae TaxID=861865 RepID=A0A239EAA6_9SPHN|nr:YceI family protein [Sphingomonas laterariae]SNS40834.1 Polyisoprenoid-binding protein YceI [Sphingomonas laterariae]